MKIALINAVCGSGSTGSICEELSDTYIAKGHECIILYGNRKAITLMLKK